MGKENLAVWYLTSQNGIRKSFTLFRFLLTLVMALEMFKADSGPLQFAAITYFVLLLSMSRNSNKSSPGANTVILNIKFKVS